MNLEAAVFLRLYLGESDGQIGHFFWRDDGEVLDVLGFFECDVAMQSEPEQFLHHLDDADARRDGVSREVRLVDGPLGMYAELEGCEAFRFLLREDCKQVIL